MAQSKVCAAVEWRDYGEASAYLSETYAENGARKRRIPKNGVFHPRTPIVKARETNRLVIRATHRNAPIYGAAINVEEMNIPHIWSLVHLVIWSFGHLVI